MENKKNLNIARAFTLIELLVVVAIIGILAAVGVVSFSGFTDAAKANVVKSNQRKRSFRNIIEVIV